MKTIKNTGVSLLVLLICSACERSIPFDKKEWNTTTWKDEVRTLAISKNRYGMTLWLKKNYVFCGKSADEIVEKFIDNPTDELIYKIHTDKHMSFLIREENITFMSGFAEWKETDWLEIKFDETENVLGVYMVHIDPYDAKLRTVKIICEK